MMILVTEKISFMLNVTSAVMTDKMEQRKKLTRKYDYDKDDDDDYDH